MPISYRISFTRLADLKRSAIAVLADRRPVSSPSRQLPDTDLTDPQKVLNEIAEHASDDDGFIRSDMPFQEILFRIFLTRRNQPMLLSDLHYEVTEKWSTPIRPINITETRLARVLDSDTYYGFVRVDP